MPTIMVASRLVTEATKNRPRPGTSNIDSTTNEPETRPAAAGARYVTTGRSALRKVCTNQIRKGPRPLARAVRTKSRLRTSIIAPRVSRAIGAATTIASVSAGKTRCSGRPHPQGGTQPNQRERTKDNKGPITNDGRQMPTSERPIGIRSSHEFGREDASTPTGMPTAIASASAANPS